MAKATFCDESTMNYALIFFENNYWAVLVSLIVSISFFLVRWRRFGKKRGHFYLYICFGVIAGIVGISVNIAFVCMTLTMGVNELFGFNTCLDFTFEERLSVIVQIPSSLLFSWITAISFGRSPVYFPHGE